MEIKMPKEAESLVDKWIHSNRKGILGVNYHSARKEGDVWRVKGEVEMSKGLFATEREEFEIEVSAKTGEILGR
jgi:hypothetical protein